MLILQNMGLFLIEIIFDLYIFVLMLRFLLQSIHADYYNSIVQFVIKLTRPLINPLAKFIPKFKDIDWIILVLIFIFEIIKIALIYSLQKQTLPAIHALLLGSIASIINKFINFYFYAIIFRAILSWIMPKQHTPLTVILFQLTEPLLRPIRRILPLINGFDLSPLIALIILILLSMLISYPLIQLGLQSAFV